MVSISADTEQNTVKYPSCFCYIRVYNATNTLLLFYLNYKKSINTDKLTCIDWIYVS